MTLFASSNLLKFIEQTVYRKTEVRTIFCGFCSRFDIVIKFKFICVI